MSHTDVVVVGAGAAGIAAAKTLRANGLSFVLVEATNRIGGRCWTDSKIFGVPFDVGAHWLHYGDDNFYLSYAKNNNFSVYPDSRKNHVYQNNTKLDGGLERLIGPLKVYESAVEEAVVAGDDISIEQAASDVVDKDKSTIEFLIGPWVMGKEVSELSALDYESLTNGSDWFCHQGFGALVQHYGANLPVSLNTRVESIDWSKRAVKVTTNRGTIKADNVILTVSTGVLKAQVIDFQPRLSPEKYESFQGVSMGCYEHVALLFERCDALWEADSYLVRMADEGCSGFGALLNVSGTGLVFCDIGADAGKDLVVYGEAACIDFALHELRSTLGSESIQRFVKGYATAWLTHPYSLGSYASAAPGYQHLRKTLREPVADKIFFAGEACHRTMWASVAGAHQSGVEVAKRVIDSRSTADA